MEFWADYQYIPAGARREGTKYGSLSHLVNRASEPGKVSVPGLVGGHRSLVSFLVEWIWFSKACLFIFPCRQRYYEFLSERVTERDRIVISVIAVKISLYNSNLYFYINISFTFTYFLFLFNFYFKNLVESYWTIAHIVHMLHILIYA